MAWSYSGDPSASDLDAIRFEIQDTNAAAPLLQDGEITWAIQDETGTAVESPTSLTGGPLYAAAARCCEVLARNFSMQADTTVGSLETAYSKMAANYAQRAEELRTKASGYNAPYAGGQSISEKQSFAQDPDRTQPRFRRDQFSNPWAGPGNDPDLGPPFPS